MQNKTRWEKKIGGERNKASVSCGKLQVGNWSLWRKGKAEKIFEKITAEIFPNLMTAIISQIQGLNKPQAQEAWKKLRQVTS